MEMTTIIGIMIAIVIILMGLYILLRGDSEAKGATQSLNRHEPSQQPIVPRHLRATLLAKQRPDALFASVQATSDSSDSISSAAGQDLINDQAQNSSQLAFDLDAASVSNSETEMTAISAIAARATDLVTPTNLAASTNAAASTNSAANDTADLVTLGSSDATPSLSSFGNLLDDHLGEQQRRDAEADISNADHVITLKVMANPRRALSGDKTLKVLLKYGLRYGELSCFHRHEQPGQDSALLFSVLRITDFGFAGFDLENLSTEQVQGLAFFMTFPHQKGLVGFDTMTSIAHLLAQEIEGRIFDENHQEFTPQLKMHWRDHVIDYMAKN